MLVAHQNWIKHNTLYNQIRTFVDDIRITTRGPTRTVKNKFNKTISNFITHLKHIGCKIGEKTTCLGTRQGVRNHLLRLLRRHKVKSQTSQASKDLGILTAVGVRRRTSTLDKRVKGAKLRAFRVNRLAKISRKAITLYKTGFFPQASYGIEAIGLSPTRAAELRATASQAVGPGYRGGCPITTIAITVGIQEDPRFKSTTLLVNEYFNTYAEQIGKAEHTPNKNYPECQCTQCILQKVWPRVLADLYISPIPWSKVRGPLGALMLTLREFGIEVPGPTHWITPKPQNTMDLCSWFRLLTIPTNTQTNNHTSSLGKRLRA